jgi:hypothetical protein
MSRMDGIRGFLAICCLIAWGSLCAQPERVTYFPAQGRAYAQLDPGDELIERNVLISNQEGGSNISFSLSFDTLSWSGFALGPRYGSIFSLKGQNGCYIRVITGLAENKVTEILYYLMRGRCYSIYWNKENTRWDVVENPCRQ